MGIISSFTFRRCQLMDVIHTIHQNDFKAFKRSVTYLNISDIMWLFLETIRKERQNFFDYLIDSIFMLNKNMFVDIETTYFRECFSSSVLCSDPYFAIRLLEVYDYVPPCKRPALLNIAALFKNEIVCHQIILRGTDVNSCNSLDETPLDEAVKGNNLNLVCMFLYYGACTNLLRNKPTSFVYSIICQCSEDIQRILFLYEADFNLVYKETSTLFFAIMYKSPLTLDIIESGADVNYHNLHNSITVAMLYNCAPIVFKVIWEKLDYRIWKKAYTKSVLVKFLEINTEGLDWLAYLKIIMENEAKLEQDLEYHNRCPSWQSTPIISMFYLKCCEKGIERKDLESYSFHLLSHGAYIYEGDLDTLFRKLNMITPFISSLLYMDLIKSHHTPVSIMYFKYKTEPDLNFFLSHAKLPVNLLFASLKFVKQHYFIHQYTKSQIIMVLKMKGFNAEELYELFNESESFPKLLQLSRDATRKSLVTKYAIKNSCKLYTIVKHLHIPKLLKDMLLLDVNVY